MTLIGWATHVLQWYLQKVTKMKIGVNLIKITLVRIVGCNFAIHEAGIVSNRESARHGECFGALYTPPVTSGK